MTSHLYTVAAPPQRKLATDSRRVKQRACMQRLRDERRAQGLTATGTPKRGRWAGHTPKVWGKGKARAKRQAAYVAEWRRKQKAKKLLTQKSG